VVVADLGPRMRLKNSSAILVASVVLRIHPSWFIRDTSKRACKAFQPGASSAFSSVAFGNPLADNEIA
jgi:hypothetical protein